MSLPFKSTQTSHPHLIALHLNILGLAAADIIVVLTSLVLAGFPSIFKTSYGSEVFPTMWPIQQIAWTTSIFLTISLTLERYLAVFHKKSTSMLKTTINIVCVALFALFYNVPRFLEYTTKDVPELKITNAVENEKYGLLSNEAYVMGYLTWCNLIFRLVLPLCILVFCNVRIIRKVNKHPS